MAGSRTILVTPSLFALQEIAVDRVTRYNGRSTEIPDFFPEAMEKACKYLENIVNDEIRKRERLPFEWTGTNGQLWHANVAASNCYEGTRESVGFHSDQLTYLGPYPTIASLSLGAFILPLRQSFKMTLF